MAPPGGRTVCPCAPRRAGPGRAGAGNGAWGWGGRPVATSEARPACVVLTPAAAGLRYNRGYKGSGAAAPPTAVSPGGRRQLLPRYHRRAPGWTGRDNETTAARPNHGPSRERAVHEYGWQLEETCQSRELPANAREIRELV